MNYYYYGGRYCYYEHGRRIYVDRIPHGAHRYQGHGHSNNYYKGGYNNNYNNNYKGGYNNNHYNNYKGNPNNNYKGGYAGGGNTGAYKGGGANQFRPTGNIQHNSNNNLGNLNNHGGNNPTFQKSGHGGGNMNPQGGSPPPKSDKKNHLDRL